MWSFECGTKRFSETMTVVWIIHCLSARKLWKGSQHICIANTQLCKVNVSSSRLWPLRSSFLPREHRVQDGKVSFALGVSVQGDVVVSIYHMRSTIGGRLQAKVHSTSAAAALFRAQNKRAMADMNHSNDREQMSYRTNPICSALLGVQHSDLPDPVPHRLHYSWNHHVKV